MAENSLHETVDRVAEYLTTMDVEGEDWQRAVAINGLLAADTRLDTARRLTDRAITTQTSDGQFAYGWGEYPKQWGEWTDYDVNTYKPTANSAALAVPALKFYRRTGDETYLDAVSKQYEFFDTVTRTDDGGISRRGDKVELFTEIIYFLSPFFVHYGQLIDESGPVEEAIRQIEVHTKHLHDPHTHLFRHVWQECPNSYPEGSFWSRGNGWAVAGLLDTILALPDDHPQRESLIGTLADTLDAVVELQDDSGFWRQRLDDPTSPLETSGTLIFAYTLKRCHDGGVASNDNYLDAADRALDACRGIVTSEGAVSRVSKPPASAMSPMGVTPYGQGWFLLAASAFL